MRMNQDERRFDFHGLGAALKRAREEKGWTQAYVAELVDRDSRTIMNIENNALICHLYSMIFSNHSFYLLLFLPALFSFLLDGS